MRVQAQGLYKPAGTSYAIYEATLENGDTHCAGAFSEKEFLEGLKPLGKGGSEVGS